MTRSPFRRSPFQRYRVTRFCCISGLCIDCHKRGNHGDAAKRSRIVHADNLSEVMAKRMVAGWLTYSAQMEKDVSK